MKNALLQGKYENLPIEQYHADSAVGSSSLKMLARKTPLHLRGQTYEAKPAFDFGTALHTMVLEPHDNHKIIRGPEDRRGLKWSKLKEETDAAGKLLLTSSDYDDVLLAAESIRTHELASSLLTGNVKAEISLFHEIAGQRVKIRPDLVNFDGNVIVDIKTCRDASPRAFAKSCYDYGYQIQASYYKYVWEDYHGTALDGFIFLAVESFKPFAVALYELDEDSLIEGMNLVHRGLKEYRECRETNSWPGYSQKIQTIRIPDYGFQTLGLEND